jgi:hypothetical protein
MIRGKMISKIILVPVNIDIDKCTKTSIFLGIGFKKIIFSLTGESIVLKITPLLTRMSINFTNQ